jgi:hypothetical protein
MNSRRTVAFEEGYRNPLWGDPALRKPELDPAALETTTTDAPNEEFPPLIVPPARDWHAITNKLTAPAWNALTAVEPENQEQSENKGAMLAVAINFARELEALLSAAHASRVERLVHEHQDASAECRLQLGAVDAAKVALDDYQATLRTVNAKLGRARADLFAWGAYEPDLNNFPTAEQVAIWRDGKLLREQAVAAAETEQGDAFATDRRLRSNVMKEFAKLKPLTARELQLRNELSGGEFFDAEFGLKHGPEV